jgi:hypothetical protein
LRRFRKSLFPFLSDSIQSAALKAEELDEFRAQIERVRNSLDDLEKVGKISLLAYRLWQEWGMDGAGVVKNLHRRDSDVALDVRQISDDPCSECKHRRVFQNFQHLVSLWLLVCASKPVVASFDETVICR